MRRPNSGDRRPGPAGGTGEFEAIEAFRIRFEEAARILDPHGPLPPDGEVWIGDDAAVVTAEEGGSLVMATDLVVAGVHVDLAFCSLGDAGYKALMVTVSDLAAMGARPHHALVSVAAPAGTDLDALGEGLAQASVDSGCVVVGGDLSSGPVLAVSTAVTGGLRRPPGVQERIGPLLRSGARPGDHLVVTGPLGASAAGLRLLRAERPGRDDAGSVPGDPVADQLRLAHRRPRARVAEGEVARWAGARAAIDVSDGLVGDVLRLAAASGVGVELHAIPAAPGATGEEARHGGEEYELVLATPDPGRLTAAFEAAGLRPPLPLGRCTDRSGQCTVDGDPVTPSSWQHRF